MTTIYGLIALLLISFGIFKWAMRKHAKTVLNEKELEDKKEWDIFSIKLMKKINEKRRDAKKKLLKIDSLDSAHDTWNDGMSMGDSSRKK